MTTSTEVHDWVRTAPQPTLTINGAAATIAGVRYVWSVRCSRRRDEVAYAWADGGTIAIGIRLLDPAGTGPRGGGRVKNVMRARWYERDIPPTMPGTVQCSVCGEQHSVALATSRAPLSVANARPLMSEAYETIRANPELAEIVACADAAAGIAR